MKIEVPIRTTSTNAKLGKHWRQLRRIVSVERGAVVLVWRSFLVAAVESGGGTAVLGHFPLVVLLTRVSPRQLDDDNLRGALKAVRDQVAEELGVDDRDPRVEWSYAQERGKPRVYLVRVEVSSKDGPR